MASVDGVYVGPIELDEVPQLIDDLARPAAAADKQLRRRSTPTRREHAESGPARSSRSSPPARRRRSRRSPPARRCPPTRTAATSPPRSSSPDRPSRMTHDQPALQGHRRAGPEHARGLRAARRLRAAARARWRWSPRTVLAELQASGLRGRGGAGFAMGKKASFLPKGAMDKYLCCNADESEPGTFKDRELMQKNPHLLIEGMVIAAYAAGINRAFIYIRGEYAEQADILDAAVAEAEARPGPTSDGPAARRPPRRGRVHLRRGDRAARLARGQARQPAPQAAVPGQPGPLPGPDAHQQRRDARDRPAHHRDGRRGVREDRHRDLDGHEARLGVRQRAAAGQLRDRARHRRRGRSSTTSPAGRPRAARSSSGSPAARARRSCTKDDLDLAYDFDTMAKAGSMLGSGAIIVVDDSNSVVDVALKVAKFYAPRVVRQVLAVPRGHELDREDDRADAGRRGHADGPRHHGLGPDQHHRQLPVRARRRDGDADRLDGREVPARVRGVHRGAPRVRSDLGTDEPVDPPLQVLQGAR